MPTSIGSVHWDEFDRDYKLTMSPAPHGFSPLSDEEIDELEAFLMEDRDGAEAMMFDTMDGYMHAVAIGPTTLKPQQWLPPIWGHTQAQGMVPAAQSLEQINRILELVMRHFNSIIAALEDERPDIYPHWSVREFEGREFDDAEGWAWGFVQGVDLCRADWQPLLETDQGLVPADRTAGRGRLRARTGRADAHAGTEGRAGLADPRSCPGHARPLASPAPSHSRTSGGPDPSGEGGPKRAVPLRQR
ncbi:MAG: hypothetical protein RL277_1862 [Planctomycetota bacterium]